jgi:hypothetical protein
VGVAVERAAASRRDRLRIKNWYSIGSTNSFQFSTLLHYSESFAILSYSFQDSTSEIGHHLIR